MSATIHRLPAAPSPEHSRLIQALDTIKVRQQRPTLRTVSTEPRDMKKWRKRYNAFLRHQLETTRCTKR